MKYFIGDIHGMFKTLESLIKKIREEDDDPKFIFVGDYIDRGPNSKEVLDLCIKLKNEGHSFIRGNHDDVLDFIFNDDSYTDFSKLLNIKKDVFPVTKWWLQFGLKQTCDSYNIEVKLPGESNDDFIYRIIESLRSIIPIEHKDFIRNLPMYYEDDSHFSIHSFYRWNKKLPKSLKLIDFKKIEKCYDSLWSYFTRKEIGYIHGMKCSWNKIGVFGHKPTSFYNSPTMLSVDKIRLIDTGSCFEHLGILTAYCADTEKAITQSAID